MKRRFVGLLLIVLTAALPVLADPSPNEGCNYWLCTISGLGANCSILLNKPHNVEPPNTWGFSVGCQAIEQSMPMGGTVYFCRYQTMCYEV